MQAVEEIKSIEDKLNATSQIGHLLVLRAVKQNIISNFIPHDDSRSKIRYEKDKKNAHIQALNEIKTLLEQNPFVNEQNAVINELIRSLLEIYKYSETESMVFLEIKSAYEQYATQLRAESQEDQTKTQEFNNLLENISHYIYLNR